MNPNGGALIRFKCPSCQKLLGVKAQLAGKRVACPNCKKPVTIPTPKPTRTAAEVEDLASSLLAEAAAAEAAARPAPKIEMTCPFCSEDVQFDFEPAGKKEPCPNCRRILKVPVPEEGPARHWRETKSGPRFAKETQEQKLEGAWDTQRTGVGSEVLEEAGAMPARPREPIGVMGWVWRVGLGAAAVLLLVGAYFGVRHLQTQRAQTAALADAKAVYDKHKDKMPRSWQGEYHRALGEYHALAGEAVDARSKFLAAYSFFNPAVGKPATPEEEILLIDVALSLIDLGGSEDDAREKKRISWPEVQKELGRVLENIPSPEGKLYALRRVGLKLLKKGQGALGLGLAQQTAGAGGAGSPLAAAQVAMMHANKVPDQAKLIAKPPTPEDKSLDAAVRLGYAEGKAHEGNFQEARKIAAVPGGLALDRLKAHLAVAEVALHQDNSEEAKAAYDEAVKVADGELKKRTIPPVVMYQIAWLSARLNSDQAREWAEAIPDPGSKALAQYQILKHKGQTDPSALDPKGISDKSSLAYVLAAEGQARLRPSEAAPDTLEETVQPFVHLGLALNQQDRNR